MGADKWHPELPETPRVIQGGHGEESRRSESPKCSNLYFSQSIHDLNYEVWRARLKSLFPNAPQPLKH